MNRCRSCQAVLTLRSSKVSEQVAQQIYWCPACRSQKIQSVLTIPGAAFDLNPYSHYEQMCQHNQAGAESSPADNRADTVVQNCRRRSA